MANVGVSISISPEGAVSGGRIAETSLDKIESAADGATASTGRLRDELNSAAVAARNSSQTQAQYQKSLQNTAGMTQRLTMATNGAGASMNQFRGFVGQAGFQISDIATHLSMGANAAMVFGIQGGQLLGFLNPMAGALATVAGILIGQFTGGMYASADSTRELEKAVGLTNKQLNALSKTQARLSAEKLEESIAADMQAYKEASAEVAVLTREVERLQQRTSAVTESQVFGKGFLLGAENLYQFFAEDEKSLKEAQDRRAILEDQIYRNREALMRYREVLSGETLDEENAEDVAKRREETLASMANTVQVLQLRTEGHNREAEIQSALFRTGAEKGSDYYKEVVRLAGAQYDLQKRLRDTNSTLREYDRDGEYLSTLQEQINLVGLSARQQAILQAQYRLSADATQKQIDKARELAAALYDAQQAQRGPDTSDRDFESQVTGMSVAIATENETLLEQLQNQRDMILLYQEQGIGDAEAHASAIAAIDRRALSERLSLASSGFGSLLQLQRAWGDDSSDVYKTLFVAQKAASLASVLVSSYSAIAQAWASAPFPANLPAVATTTVETGALQALASAVTPAFATGGLALGPGTGTSDSFTARLSNGEFIMPAQQTSRNLPLLESMRAGNDVSQGGSVKVNIINRTTGRVDSTESNWVSKDQLDITIYERVPEIMAEQLGNEYSRSRTTLESQYRMTRNL